MGEQAGQKKETTLKKEIVELKSRQRLLFERRGGRMINQLTFCIHSPCRDKVFK